MDERLEKINNFHTRMTEYKILRHPLKTNIEVTLCEVTKDIYGDSTSVPEQKVNKVCVIQKTMDMDYLNTALGILMEENEKLPWLVYLTLIGLPRTLMHGDYITADGEVYKVSAVRPVNRQNPNVIRLLIHPERDDFDVTIPENQIGDDANL